MGTLSARTSWRVSLHTANSCIFTQFCLINHLFDSILALWFISPVFEPSNSRIFHGQDIIVLQEKVWNNYSICMLYHQEKQIFKAIKNNTYGVIKASNVCKKMHLSVYGGFQLLYLIITELKVTWPVIMQCLSLVEITAFRLEIESCRRFFFFIFKIFTNARP